MLHVTDSTPMVLIQLNKPYGPSKYTLIQVYYVLVYNNVIHAMQSKYCINYLRFDANDE